MDNTETVAAWMVALEVYAKETFTSDEHAELVGHIRRIRKDAEIDDELAETMVSDVIHMLAEMEYL